MTQAPLLRQSPICCIVRSGSVYFSPYGGRAPRRDAKAPYHHALCPYDPASVPLQRDGVEWTAQRPALRGMQGARPCSSVTLRLFTEPWTKETNIPEVSASAAHFFCLHERTLVAKRRAPIVKRGVPCNFAFDVDAIELLREMVPSKKGYGRYLSELLRNEQIRREERQRIKAAMLAEAERACG
jgi:hypothetical protein